MIDQALVIQKVWLDKILSGEKTWEMRSLPTKKRGLIGLIEKGSGKIVGVARITETRLPLTRRNWSNHFDRHKVPQELADEPSFNWFVPWVLSDVQKLAELIRYQHPIGAVQFVNLSEGEKSALSEAVARCQNQKLVEGQQSRPPRAGVAEIVARHRRIAKRRYEGVGVIATIGLGVSSLSLFFYIICCVFTGSGRFSTFLWLAAAVVMTSAAAQLCLTPRKPMS